ncbi:MAG TPA: transcription termination/antitermination protein NusG [Thermoguttaceae bacterium]|nr:transcription termination/antitermination protein NusG [Thermoguttaceae bacterium]
MTDEPNNPTDQPRDLSEETSAESVVAQSDAPVTVEPAPSVETAEADRDVASPGTADAAATEPATETATTDEEVSQPESVPVEETAAADQDVASPGTADVAVTEPAAEAESAMPAEKPAEKTEKPAEKTKKPAEKTKKPVKKTKKPAAETKKKPAIQPAEEETLPEEPKSENMDWYILKVQSNREDSIRDGLLRRVAIAGLEHYFGDVIVPTEKVTEFKGGKKRVAKRKLYPGYLVIQMEINDDTWFLVRETPGIGDFTGAAGRPTPMLPHEVSRILVRQEEKSEKAPKLKIGVSPGDQVKINEGTFENFEGEVDSIDETNGRVTVMINIFGRSTPVELEYWQIEAV